MKALGLVTLLFISLRCVTAKKGDPFQPMMSIRLDRCTSYCNPKYCNISTVCRPLNRTSKFVSTDIYFNPGVKVKAPIYIKLVTHKKFATVYRPHMVNYKTELCRELLLRTYPLIFGLLQNTAVFENLLEPCPLTGHRGTVPRISNIYEYVSPLLPIVPAGEWRLDVIVAVERNGSEVIVFSWNDYYEVKVLTAEEF